MKEKEKIYELMTHICSFEKGDIVKFIKDCEFQNLFDSSDDSSVVVKKDTLAKVLEMNDKFVSLKIKGDSTNYLIELQIAKDVLIRWG